MPDLAYILAASHSGSTLLAMLLGAHPDACTVGELKATSLGDLERYRCSCGELINICPFWCGISRAMARRGVDGFDITRSGTCFLDAPGAFVQRLLAPLHRGVLLEAVRDTALFLSPGWRTHLRETQRRNAALVSALQEVTGAKVIVDSSKQALRLKYLLRDSTLDIKVIHLVRDGRAVAMAYTDEWRFADAVDPAMRGGGTGRKPEPTRRNMAEAAREWRRSNEAAECLLAGLEPARWVNVRYEDLCNDPSSVLRRLIAFLGLDPEAVTLNYRAKDHHVIGNGMRMDRTSEICMDERWRNHITDNDARVFQRVAGARNRQYGNV